MTKKESTKKLFRLKKLFYTEQKKLIQYFCFDFGKLQGSNSASCRP